MVVLVTNGCSFTAGDELADADFFPEYADPVLWQKVCLNRKQAAWDDGSIHRLRAIQRERAWPRHLANLLPVKRLDNLALGGTSTTRMVRATIPHVLRLLESGVSPEDIIVILQWTDPTRIERYDGSGSDYYCMLMNFAPYEGPRAAYLKHYIRHFQNDVYDTKMMVQNALLLQSFFREKGIEFLFFEAQSWITKPELFEPMLKQDADLRALWTEMDKDRWLPRAMDSLLTTDPAEIMPFGHYSEAIHVRMAAMLRDALVGKVRTDTTP